MFSTFGLSMLEVGWYIIMYVGSARLCHYDTMFVDIKTLFVLFSSYMVITEKHNKIYIISTTL